MNTLIEILFDQKASITEKDEAATNLAEFSDAQAINALILKGRDLKENELLLNSCGESLGAIWVRKNIFDEKVYRTLSGTARYGVYIVVKSRKPEWVDLHALEKDSFLN